MFTGNWGAIVQWFILWCLIFHRTFDINNTLDTSNIIKLAASKPLKIKINMKRVTKSLCRSDIMHTVMAPDGSSTECALFVDFIVICGLNYVR